MMTVKNKSNELHLCRVYDAPVKAVWEAWTDPEQVAQWWGPRGFTITTHSKDLRPGGHWNYTMHGPDGVDYPNTTTYFEVEECARLVYDHGASEGKPPLFRVTATFAENEGKTTLNMTMSLATPEAAEEIRKFIKKAGGNATWDRLAEYLDKKLIDKESFVINRSFEAPIETVFEMWTNKDHLAKWMGPAGSEMQFIKCDIKPGGNSLYCMTMGNLKMYGRAHYLEIEKPHRIVYTQQFCDENENLARHPMAPSWPATMLTTITLAAEGPNQTRVTINWECYGETSAEELATFIQGRSGMTIGWTGSFDKLEEYLSAL
ncbi:MAG: SRPBCC domain-containing protein [Candidatus Obscuribacterales bacterium]|nr:SRPBCC domain-containing protein [Candidatus Obscuribacterales bacterium]